MDVAAHFVALVDMTFSLYELNILLQAAVKTYPIHTYKAGSTRFCQFAGSLHSLSNISAVFVMLFIETLLFSLCYLRLLYLMLHVPND